MNFNILLTSLSAKVSWIKAVRHAFEQLELQGSIIGADCSTPCIGSFFVDKFWQMPPLEELTPKKLLDECHEREIRAIIPSRDGELAFFAKNRDLFIKNGIALMVSPASAVEICFDNVDFGIFAENIASPASPHLQRLKR